MNTAVALVAGERPSANLVARAEALFDPSFGGPGLAKIQAREVGPVWLVTLDNYAAPRISRDDVVWGTPIGNAGAASDEELDHALVNPAAARHLLGRFVGIRLGQERGLAVTGSELSHTLKRSKGPLGDVVSTSGLLAALLSGHELTVNAQAIGEYLVSDVVVGDDELLNGVEVLDEASRIDFDATGFRVSSYWPIEERLSPERPPEPTALWTALQERSERIFKARTSWLALTAGRDSTLLAATAVSHGNARCFTFGPSYFPDVIGARATCSTAGFPYQTVEAGTRKPTMVLARGLSPWTDGLTTARDLVGATWTPRLPGITSVTGHGGEVGRAFYWKNAAADSDGFVATFGEALPRRWRPQTRDRVKAELDRYTHLGGAAAQLDVFYARNRVRKWTCRGVRRDEIWGSVHGFGDPELVRMLLSVPVEQRRTGSFFEAVLELDPLRLLEVAKRAVAKADVAPPLPSQIRAEQQRVARFAAATSLKSSLVMQTYGVRWWSQVVRQALRPADRHARRLFWNAIAVDALDQALRAAP